MPYLNYTNECKFLGFLEKRYIKAGTANTAFSSAFDTDFYNDMKLGGNRFAVFIRGFIRLNVTGGNADGDDSFALYVVKKNATSVAQAQVWVETIAAASLLQNSVHDRSMPFHTSPSGGCDIGTFVVREDETLWVTASAGGLNVVYTLTLTGLWAIYELPADHKFPVVRK